MSEDVGCSERRTTRTLFPAAAYLSVGSVYINSVVHVGILYPDASAMTITLDYSAKLILITGGGRGIGYAIARALASAGGTLAITYTHTDASDIAKALCEEFGVVAKAFKCEASDSKDTDRMVQDVEACFGKKVDIAIANAGVALWKDAHAMTDGELHDVQGHLALNCVG